MRTRKYYWTLGILAVLFVFVIVADLAGLIGLFTGGKAPAEDAAVGQEVVTTTEASEPEEAAQAEDAAEDAPADAAVADDPAADAAMAAAAAQGGGMY